MFQAYQQLKKTVSEDAGSATQVNRASAYTENQRQAERVGELLDKIVG